MIISCFSEGLISVARRSAFDRHYEKLAFHTPTLQEIEEAIGPVDPPQQTEKTPVARVDSNHGALSRNSGSDDLAKSGSSIKSGTDHISEQEFGSSTLLQLNARPGEVEREPDKNYETTDELERRSQTCPAPLIGANTAGTEKSIQVTKSHPGQAAEQIQLSLQSTPSFLPEAIKEIKTGDEVSKHASLPESIVTEHPPKQANPTEISSPTSSPPPLPRSIQVEEDTLESAKVANHPPKEANQEELSSSPEMENNVEGTEVSESPPKRSNNQELRSPTSLQLTQPVLSRAIEDPDKVTEDSEKVTEAFEQPLKQANPPEHSIPITLGTYAVETFVGPVVQSKAVYSAEQKLVDSEQSGKGGESASSMDATNLLDQNISLSSTATSDNMTISYSKPIMLIKIVIEASAFPKTK